MTMDYKYIEQLLDRYFECETSLDEEQILRAFFAQENVPVRLLSYRELFIEPADSKLEETLSDDFDARVLAAIGTEEQEKHVKARIIPLYRRLRPLYKAAASVAVVLAIGQAAQMPYQTSADNQERIARSIERPKVYENLNTVAKGDSAHNATPIVETTSKADKAMAN